MKSRLKFTLSWLVLLPASVCAVASDDVYLADFEQSRWSSESSVFECSLRQEIPRLGEATFYRQAGTQTVFYLDSSDSAMQEGRAMLTSMPPQWRHGHMERDLGYVDVVRSNRPVNVDAARSRMMLAELEKGMVPTLVRRAWYDEEVAVRVGVSPVNFSPAYREFVNCQAELLPVNFQQIERSTVFWKSGQRELDAAARRQLDNIVAYAKADPGVFSFEINGFTDSAGSGRENLELSRIRAYAVHNYLLARGIDASMLSTRYFGATEDYRIIRHERSAADRDRNRRVTIRIQRR